jgi:ubiquinone/menaquinone biosynthesis C-methylase UbiE
MTITEAAALIKPGLEANIQRATWADLGCGSGIFTKALATCLHEGSIIYAVDKEAQLLKSQGDVKIEFLKLDFIRDDLPFFNLDGLLMANALHYVKDKMQFLEKAKRQLKPDAQMIIVEYDAEIPNHWVPYPISFLNLVETCQIAGFAHIKKIGERNSVYNAQKMYACSVKR